MPPFQQIGTARLNPEQAGVEAASSPPANPVENPAHQPPAEPLTFDQVQDLNEKIVAVLCTCFDPEIPVNIYELGLIYEIQITPTAEVALRMTLTSPGCPVATTLPPEVQRKVQAVPGVVAAKVEVVWDPPWDKSRMSEAAKLQLGIDDW